MYYLHSVLHTYIQTNMHASIFFTLTGITYVEQIHIHVYLAAGKVRGIGSVSLDIVDLAVLNLDHGGAGLFGEHHSRANKYTHASHRHLCTT